MPISTTQEDWLLFDLIALLSFGQLVSTSLLKVDHAVIAHLIARAMLTENKASQFNTQFLNHEILLVLNLKCKRKYSFALTVVKNGLVFKIHSA